MYEQEVAGKNSKKPLKNPENAGFFLMSLSGLEYIFYIQIAAPSVATAITTNQCAG